MSDFDFPKFVEWQTLVATYDVDLNRRLKFSSQMKMQQEVGEIHLCECNLPYAVLYDKGMVWVLTKTRTKIYRQPTLEEKVKITTWQKMSKGVQYYRCYKFENEQGELLIDACTAFALVDPKSHNLIRPKVFRQMCDVENSEIVTTCPNPEKIKRFETMDYTGTKIVRYSDIDYNGHLNNTVYADLICDFLPKEYMGKAVNEYSIEFLSEALLGDEIKIYIKQEQETFYIMGEHVRGNCFYGFIKFD